MAIFDRVPCKDLGARFTHYGWFCGLCPVYIGNIDAEAPELAERNWVPAWWFTAVEQLFGMFIFVNTLVDPDFEPAWPIMITGLIDKTER